jgi:peptidoglycan/LPS O-acetylase OafA/YrhL/lysophospholipase L1-like esterase
MPEPVRGGQRYLPGLDGLRAVAVLAVIAYHEQFAWAPGGLLGVGVFFTLSGYLITDLLLSQWCRDGELGLGGFWLRRARRLLPALFVMLAVVSAWVSLFGRSQLASLRGALPAAAAYVSNWYLIGAHSSYFARFAPPAPLDHLWSLAVEEQFYLLWPWLLILGLACLPVRRRAWEWWRSGPTEKSRAPWLALPTLALAAASAVLMFVLYQPGVDPTRVYEGTDTRAAGLLIGAVLAMVWPTRRAAGLPGKLAVSRWSRPLIDGLGVAGLAVIAVLIWRVGEYSPFIYQGGMTLLAVATAAVVAAVAWPGSLVGVALGWRPLRWIGVRSYGIYLWHYPVIVLTTPVNATEDLTRATLQIFASIGLAAVSWRFVEEPIRHGALGKLWRRARSARWDLRSAGLSGRAGLVGWAAMVSASGVLVVACAGLAGAFPGGSPSATAAAPQTTGPTSLLPVSHSPGTPASGSPSPSGAAGSAPAGGPLRTSCKTVLHIGDSTSEGLISRSYLPNKARRIPARYADVGVQRTYTFIEGATSIVETLPGTLNAYDGGRRFVQHGFDGCWVLALGTNDTADIVVGSTISRAARIARMMQLAHGEPVMWVDVKSLRATGPYAEPYMQEWNEALLHACAKYPNMRIFDWASVVKNRWFISDGIHFTSAGYAARAKQIANALARAFPATGQSTSCVVNLSALSGGNAATALV